MVQHSFPFQVELLDWGEEGAGRRVGTLKAHTRVIKDLSWHEQDTNLLATG